MKNGQLPHTKQKQRDAKDKSYLKRKENKNQIVR